MNRSNKKTSPWSYCNGRHFRVLAILFLSGGVASTGAWTWAQSSGAKCVSMDPQDAARGLKCGVEAPGTPDGYDTSLVQKLPAKQDRVSLLKFQAQERRSFFSELAAEKSRKAASHRDAEKGLREQQRLARQEFQSTSQQPDQRRQFFLNQRQEMRALVMSHRVELKEMEKNHRQRVKDLMARQTQDRQQFEKAGSAKSPSKGKEEATEGR